MTAEAGAKSHKNLNSDLQQLTPKANECESEEELYAGLKSKQIHTDGKLMIDNPYTEKIEKPNVDKKIGRRNTEIQV
jgi:hypothetical protein